jgi:hypothetical protein
MHCTQVHLNCAPTLTLHLRPLHSPLAMAQA